MKLINKPLVINRFKKITSIGQGSCSKVLHVFDYTTLKNRALKMIPLFSEEVFINEIKILQLITNNNRNNIVKLIESFSYNNDYYIILKLYHISLSKYIKNNTSTINKTINISKEIFKGLSFLKKKCIIHFDIKPDNILFKTTNLDSIVIIDFGISIHLKNKPHIYNKPTIYYRSPEIIFNGNYDYSVDIWGLGCIIYEIYYRVKLYPYITEAELFLNQNLFLGPPSLEFLIKYPESHKLYDNIYSPTKIFYNNNTYNLPSSKLKISTNDSILINLIRKCCCWDTSNRLRFNFQV